MLFSQQLGKADTAVLDRKNTCYGVLIYILKLLLFWGIAMIYRVFLSE